MQARFLPALVALAMVASVMPMVGADHPQPARGDALVFDHKTGNEWWVEVVLKGGASGAVSTVESRDDGGSWKPLSKRSWGAWAGSYHIEPGHRVQFRASFAGGEVVESCWFTHPQGVEQCGGTPDPAPSTFTFQHRGGNEWWVEVRVTPEPAAVEARDTDSVWKALTKRSWGNWAGSFHIEPGMPVQFRARTATGPWVESCWYSHPAGAQIRCDPPPGAAWPVEGSFVKYEASSGEGVPGYSDWTEVNVTYRYQSGSWGVECEGWRWTVIDGELRTEERIMDAYAVAWPPRGPTSAKPGDQATAPGVHCLAGSGASGTMFGPVEQPTRRNGTDVSAVAWYLEFEPEYPKSDDAAWEVRTGLVLRWTDARSHSGDSGTLVDTDAPIAKTDPPTLTRSSWPFEGSFAHYFVDSGGDDTDYILSYRFQGGAWHLECVPLGFKQETYARAPPQLRTTTRVGEEFYAPLPEGCWTPFRNVLVKGQFPEDTTRNGASYRARVWWADEDASYEEFGGDRDAWWDVRTGLLLRWENDEHGGVRGRLTDTDAPLAAW